MKNNIVSAALILGFLALPYMGMAAQRVITVQSLDSAYKAQVAAIDAQIAPLSDEATKLQAAQPVNTYRLVGKGVTDFKKNSNQIMLDIQTVNQLKIDKHNLEVTYTLLLESLK